MGIREETVEKGFLTVRGCEAESNDGLVKIMLQKRTITQLGEISQKSVIYNTIIYVKCDGKWERSEGNTSNFLSVREFVNTLRQIKDFSIAAEEISMQLHR